MKIGTPREIKNHEYRVGITPVGVRELVALGHEVYVEHDCGLGVGFSDRDYINAGGMIVDNPASLYDLAELIVKVKEPQAAEYDLLKPHHTLFAYLHLAAEPELLDALIDSGANCIAYETVAEPDGSLPLLAPMSQVAGKVATQVGAHYLEKAYGGRGILLGGVLGVEPAEVLVLGGGAVGSSAIEIALGMGANVTLVDRSEEVLQSISERYDGRVFLVNSSQKDISPYVANADLLIGAVLVPGATAPQLVSDEMVKSMRPRSVVVDVAIDQGGCIATSRPTTHDSPIYNVYGVTHYCVTNIPSAVAYTSTMALTNQTLAYIKLLCHKGPVNALKNNPALQKGLNVCQGRITNESLAKSIGRIYVPFADLLGDAGQES